MAITNEEFQEAYSIANQEAYTAYELAYREAHPDYYARGTAYYNARLSLAWGRDQDTAVRDQLDTYPDGPELVATYDQYLEDVAFSESRASKPQGGMDATTSLPLPTSDIVPAFEDPPTYSDEPTGASNGFPSDMGPNAYISIDPASYGGAKWLEKMDGRNTGKNYATLNFQFLGSGEFSDVASASYAMHDVLGRSESYMTYERTQTREFNLTLKFIAQGNTRDIRDEVKWKADWCRSLAYPIYDGNIMFPPPVVLVGFGRMYSRAGLPLRCVVTTVNVTYCADEAPYDPITYDPYSVLIDISFSCVFIRNATEKMLDATSIFSGEF